MKADWQEQMTEWISGASEPDSDWFGGGPVLGPAQQIAIYQEQYRLRMYEALAEDAGGLAWLLGERAEEILWAYLRECPSNTWTLNRIADRLPEWLQRNGHPQDWVEMAMLDVAVGTVFEARGGTPLSPEEIATVPPMKLAPFVRLLHLQADWHLQRASALVRDDVPLLTRKPTWLVIFRRDVGVRHREVSEPLWSFLKKVEEGMEVPEALEATVVEFPEAIPEVGEWFRVIGEGGWLQRAEEE